MQIRFGDVNLKALGGELARRQQGDPAIVLEDTANKKRVMVNIVHHDARLSALVGSPRYVVEGESLTQVQHPQQPVIDGFFKNTATPVIQVSRYVVPTDDDGNTDMFDRL